MSLLTPYFFPVHPPNAIAIVTAAILSEVTDHHMPLAERQTLEEKIVAFQTAWTQMFARFGTDPAGELYYRDLILAFEDDIATPARPWLARGAGAHACATLNAMVYLPPEPPPQPAAPPPLLMQQWRAARRPAAEWRTPQFVRPLFIISAPRSGSTLLFETLAVFPELWTTGEENHELIESIPELHPAAHAYHSNRLTASDATPQVATTLRDQFARRLLNRDGKSYRALPPEQRLDRVRFLEKTPKNALRIPFLRAVFPDARFLILYRRPQETIASLLEGWRGRRFTAYQPLPGWPHRAWKFLLVPGWPNLIGRPLIEIVAYQWRMTYQTILDDLDELSPDAWMMVRYTDLVANPGDTLGHIAQFAELNSDERVQTTLKQGLPLSSMTFSAPHPDKWQRHAAALATVVPGLTDVIERIENLTNS